MNGISPGGNRESKWNGNRNRSKLEVLLLSKEQRYTLAPSRQREGPKTVDAGLTPSIIFHFHGEDGFGTGTAVANVGRPELLLHLKFLIMEVLK